MRAGVEPCKTSRKRLYLQFAILEKFLIYSGYLKLSASRRLDILSYLNNLVGVEIKSDNSIVAFGMFWSNSATPYRSGSFTQ